MSFTGEYTGFVVKEGEGRSPKIEDIEEWNSWKKAHEHLADAAKTGTVTEGEYPKQEYKTLRGFKTWDEDSYRGYNIERLAYRYDRDRFVEFLKNLSNFVETPFYFYHAEQEYWPKMDSETVWRTYEDNREMGSVFKVTVFEGRVEVEKSTVKATEFEEEEVFE